LLTLQLQLAVFTLQPISHPVLQPGVQSEILVMRGDAPFCDVFETETKSRLKSFVLIM
jgi:hypothetical protein